MSLCHASAWCRRVPRPREATIGERKGVAVKGARYSIRISWRFALVLAVLLPALVAVTAAGIHG